MLEKMDITIISLAKKEGENKVLLALDIYPENLALYDSANWNSSFSNFSHDLTFD